MEVMNKMERIQKSTGLVDQEMLRQPRESKMAYIKRTVMRCYRKRIAKAELLLLRAECPIRPSNAGVNNTDTKLLFTTDRPFAQRREGSKELDIPDLTDLIKGSIYNR
jgi:hypothetical protein